VENHLRRQLKQYLANRVPLPALRVYQVPVFYSLAISLYVETERPEAPEALAAALAGGHIRVRRRNEPSPSQVEAAGSSNILVDTVAPDPDHPTGIWIWAVVDNIRLAAVNAVEIAESLRDRIGP
jgi:aspartate-semialdehyde dehydrogenase